MENKLSKELTKGGIILFICFNIFNFLNLIFNFMAARFLGPVDYGILATLMSIIFIFSIPNEAIQTIISRFSTKFNVEKDKGKIKNLMIKGVKKFAILSVICFLIFASFSSLIGKFLFIENRLILLTGIFLFGTFLIPITRGILQGTKKFSGLGFTYVSESLIKLILAIALLVIGWGVYGAITGVILGILAAFVLSFFSLKDILGAQRKKVKIEGIYSYSLPTLISLASIMVFFSLDTILARRFFPADTVGYYSAISNLGKIIFLGTWGISRAMFPLASEKHDEKKDAFPLLEQSFLVVLLISAAVLFFYFTIPKQIISILYGNQYTVVSGILIYPSIAMTILALTNIFVLYNLCVNKPKRNYLTIFFTVLQVILLSLFHASLMQFMLMLILSNILFFLGMFIISFKD